MSQAEIPTLYRTPQNPGYLGKYNWPALGAGIIAFVITNIITTQHMASYFEYQPALGPALTTIGKVGLYSPHEWIVWVMKYGNTNDPAIRQPMLHSILIAAIGFAVSLLLVAALNIHRNKNLTDNMEDLHGSARWATEEEIKKSGLLDRKDGVYIGGWREPKKDILKYLRHGGPEHILAFAPTRSGKGVGLVIPSLLAWEGSSVIFDIKGENWDKTAGYRTAAGQVCFRFSPVEENSARINPLAEVRIGTLREVSDAQNIAEMLCRTGKESSQDEHWIKSASSLITGLILHLCYVARNQGRFATLTELANALTPLASDLDTVIIDDAEGPVDVVRTYFSMLMETNHALPNNPWRSRNGTETRTHPVVSEKMQEMLNREDKEFSGVLSTAKTALQLYSDPLVQRCISASDFTINDLKHFKYPVSLYLVVPPSDIERLKPLIRLIFTMTVNRLTEELEEVRNARIKQSLKPGEEFTLRPDHRLLLLIDEFPTLGKMPIFQTAFAYIAGYGIKAYLITQDTEQITDAYGEHESIISNCHIRIAYAPNKSKTAEEISKWAGTATILKTQVSYSGTRSSPLATSVSTNVDALQRPLITVDELMRLPGPVKEGEGREQRIVAPGAMLIFIAGQSPIFGTQLLYFQDETLNKRSKTLPPVSGYIIEHNGDILSQGKLYKADHNAPTVKTVPGPTSVTSTEQLTLPTALAVPVESATNNSDVNNTADKQIHTNSEVELIEDIDLDNKSVSDSDVDAYGGKPGALTNAFEEANEGIESFDQQFRLYTLEKTPVGAKNER